MVSTPLETATIPAEPVAEDDAEAPIEAEAPEQWVTISQAAKHLGISPDRVRRRLKAGEFEARQVPTRYGPTWEIKLASLRPRDSGTTRVAPTLGAGVADASTVGPTVATAVPVEDDRPAMLELVRLVRHQQDQIAQLAGQVGFLQAQLQHAQETIKLLQAPPAEPKQSHEAEKLDEPREPDSAPTTPVEAAAAAQRANPRPWWKFW